DFSLFNNVPLKSSYPIPRAIPTSSNSNLEQVQDQISSLNLSICTHNVQEYNNNLKSL
ncbi:28923_t:CDS:1, partial [Gigaspora margarita]